MDRRISCALFPMLALVTACNGTSTVGITVPGDNRPHTVAVRAGEELNIILGNVGPGEFESPPDISSDNIRFLDVSVIPPFSPAGPTQQFRFLTVHQGTAIIHFRRPLLNGMIASIDDTVRVL